MHEEQDPGDRKLFFICFVITSKFSLPNRLYLKSFYLPGIALKLDIMWYLIILQGESFTVTHVTETVCYLQRTCWSLVGHLWSLEFFSVSSLDISSAPKGQKK